MAAAVTGAGAGAGAAAAAAAEEEEIRRERERERESRIIHSLPSPSTPSRRTFHRHNRSSSWSGAAALPPHLSDRLLQGDDEEDDDGCYDVKNPQSKTSQEEEEEEEKEKKKKKKKKKKDTSLLTAEAEDDRKGPGKAEEEEEIRYNSDALLPPALTSPSHSHEKKPESNRSRLINKIRNNVGMRLDLEAVSRDWRDPGGSDNDGDNVGDDLKNRGPQSGDSELWQRRERMVACDKECSRILPYLFVGSKTVAQNLALLHDCRITHIINCVGFVCPEFYPNDFIYKTLWLHDSPSEDLMCVFFDVIDYIEHAREQTGGRVFLHCSQGVSRAPSLAIAYLMWRKHESFEDAFYEIKSKRDVVSPNMGFAAQLMQWESRIFNVPCTNKPTQTQLYRIAPHSPYDPLYLVPKMVAKPCIEALDSRGVFLIRAMNVLYIWRGRQCPKEMVVVAGHAAFQLVRYEHAQGPGVLVYEGSEPFPMLKALSEQGVGNINRYGKCVSTYDSDFEIYWKAKSGRYVPPAVGSAISSNRLLAKVERQTLLNSPRLKKV